MTDQTNFQTSELEKLVEKGLIDDKKTQLSDCLKGTACYMGTALLLGTSFYAAYKTIGFSENTEINPALGSLVIFGGMALTGLAFLTAITLPQIACYFLTKPTERIGWKTNHAISENSRMGAFYSWLDKRTADKCRIYQ